MHSIFMHDKCDNFSYDLNVPVGICGYTDTVTAYGWCDRFDNIVVKIKAYFCTKHELHIFA